MYIKGQIKQECIPVGCVPAAHRLYAGVCTPGGVWSGGEVCSGGRGVSAPGVSAPGGGVSAQGGVCCQGGRCLVWGAGGVWSGGCLLLGGLVQGGLPLGGGVYIPACTEADTLPPCGQNSWHTLVKILPWPNFVAAGNNVENVGDKTQWTNHQQHQLLTFVGISLVISS